MFQQRQHWAATQFYGRPVAVAPYNRIKGRLLGHFTSSLSDYTRDMPSAQFKWWLLTSWCDSVHYIHPEELMIEHSNIIDYAKGQQEICPTTGREHWQWIMHTKKKMTATAVHEIVGDGDVCWVIGMTKNNADNYVHKDDTKVPGTEFEFGMRPFDNTSAVEWREQLDLFRANNFEAMNPRVFITHARSFSYASSLMIQPTSGPKEVYIFQGAPGTGKSRAVWERECGPDTYDTNKLYVISNNKWWDGYRGQEAVLFDEYMGQWSIDWLLKIMDRYPVTVEVKGSSVGLRAKRLYFTSNVLWEQWYTIGQNGVNGDHIEAIRRRITEVRDFY